MFSVLWLLFLTISQVINRTTIVQYSLWSPPAWRPVSRAPPRRWIHPPDRSDPSYRGFVVMLPLSREQPDRHQHGRVSLLRSVQHNHPMNNYYWGHYDVIDIVLRGVTAPLSNKHKIIDVVMTRRSYHVITIVPHYWHHFTTNLPGIDYFIPAFSPSPCLRQSSTRQTSTGDE